MADNKTYYDELQNLATGYGLDPNQAWASAGTTALQSSLSNIESQKGITSQAYSDLYQQARDSATLTGGMSNAAGLSGGMQQQYSDKLSAAQMGSLGQIGIARTQAIQDLEASKATAVQDAFSQALSARDYQMQNDPLMFDLENLASAMDNAATQEDYTAAKTAYDQALSAFRSKYYTGTTDTTGIVDSGTTTPITSLTGAETVVVDNTSANIEIPEIITPEEKADLIDTTISDALSGVLTDKEIENFKDANQDKLDTESGNIDLSAEVAKINEYNAGTLAFDEWSKINKEVFGGTGLETEYIQSYGGTPFTKDGEQAVYFDDASTPFLTYLYEKNPELLTVVPQMAEGTVPGRYKVNLTQKELLKELAAFTGKASTTTKSSGSKVGSSDWLKEQGLIQSSTTGSTKSSTPATTKTDPSGLADWYSKVFPKGVTGVYNNAMSKSYNSAPSVPYYDLINPSRTSGGSIR